METADIKHVVKYDRYMELKKAFQLLDYHNIRYKQMEVVSTSIDMVFDNYSGTYQPETRQYRHFEIRFFSDNDFHTFQLIRD